MKLRNIGFTLPEVLMVALIFSIVAGIGATALAVTMRYSFSELSAVELQQKANRATNILVSELRNAKPNGLQKLMFNHNSVNNCVISAALPKDINNDGSLWISSCEGGEEGGDCDYVLEYYPANTNIVYSVNSNTGCLMRTDNSGVVSVSQVITDNVVSFTCSSSETIAVNQQYDDGETLFFELTLEKKVPNIDTSISFKSIDGVWPINSLQE